MRARFISSVAACVFALALSSRAQQVAGQSFDSNGVQIHYVDRGGGVPVVLLHGFTGSYVRHWEATGVPEVLEKAGYRVIGMDCRGHGQSGKPREPNQYGLEMVRDVGRLLDYLRLDRAHVVGYSMGGQITSKLLVDHPSRLLTATLIGAGWEDQDLKALSVQLEESAAAFDRGDAGFLVRALTPPGQPAPTQEELAAANASLFARNDPKVLAAVTRGMVHVNQITGDSLRTNSVPALAVVGEHDRRVQEVKRLAEVMSNLEVIVLRGATHATSVKPSAEHIVAFLNKHRLH